MTKQTTRRAVLAGAATFAEQLAQMLPVDKKTALEVVARLKEIVDNRREATVIRFPRMEARS